MSNFNELWETELYGKGNYLNRYPFDNVVTFLFRNYPREKKREAIKIMEVGCGAGNNLWFAAREGFNVTGIDGSKTAIQYAKDRFTAEGLKGHFIVGDFTSLPFEDQEFDIVIDRGSLVCVNREACKQTIGHIYRVLKPGGTFFLNLYSDRHSSHYLGSYQADGFTTDMVGGMLQGVGNICFYGRNDLRYVVPDSFITKSIVHKSFEHWTEGLVSFHSEWEMILSKPR